MKRTALPALIILALLFGIWSRFSGLSSTPLQSDESVNWYFAQSIDTKGEIPYDPAKFHGPLYFRLLHYFGTESEVRLRLPAVLAGAFLLLIPFLLLPYISLMQAGIASALLSLDPVLIFYSRVSIHESLFVLISVLLSVMVVRWIHSPRLWAALIVGTCAGLLAGTKETFPLPIFAAAVAAIALKSQVPRQQLLVSVTAALLAAFVACALSFSSLNGPMLVMKGLSVWLSSGVNDSPHVQPFWYFIGILILMSPVSLLALVPRGGSSKARSLFLIAAILHLAAYSLIPYKTPWLVTGIIAPLLIALGLSLNPSCTASAVLILQLLTNLLPFLEPRLTINGTSDDVPKIAERIISHCNSVGPECRVFVSAKWYWPLPYYLRSIEKNVTYSEQPPAIPIESFHLIILSEEATKEIPGWIREEAAFSRVQRVAIYTKEARS